MAVSCYLRYGLSYRDMEELLAERGVEIDHVTVYRWVQRFTPLLPTPPAHSGMPRATAGSSTRPTSRSPAGGGTCTGPSTKHGQVIDVMLSEQRDTAAARRFFTRALRYGPAPVEVITDQAGPYLRVIDEVVPAAAHVAEQHANNRAEADHARLKAWLRPMRGLKQVQSAALIAAGYAFVQNLRRGHYELATDVPPRLRLATAFTELALAM